MLSSEPNSNTKTHFLEKLLAIEKNKISIKMSK